MAETLLQMKKGKTAKMTEKEWATLVEKVIGFHFEKHFPTLEIRQGWVLPYTSEVLAYQDKTPVSHKAISYETDLLVVEKSGETWKPRVVVEVKFGSITTHDAITYSEKAFTHKRVHPYLRYGILLGDRKQFPLPGRLFRHGHYFDFMLSWAAEEGSPEEIKNLLDLLILEVQASRDLEEILYNSRSASRKRYVLLHRPLHLR